MHNPFGYRHEMAMTISQSMAHILYASMMGRLDEISDVVAAFDIGAVSGPDPEVRKLTTELIWSADSGLEYVGLWVEKLTKDLSDAYERSH